MKSTWGVLLAWAGAAVWSAGLIAFAFAPTYATVGPSPSVERVRGTETLIGENGNWVLVVLAVPLVVTVLLGVFNLLAMLTIGLLIVPVTAALAFACLAASATAGARASGNVTMRPSDS